MPVDTPVTPVLLRPIWPNAFTTLEDSGGKLHNGQIVETNDGRLLVGKGMKEGDDQPTSYYSAEYLKINGFKAPNI